jgi:rhamnosyltransferase
MSKDKNSIKATVFVPTWFGEDFLKELLTSVFAQKVDFRYEVLIYDTSSTDGTLGIIKSFAKRHKNLRYKVITKEEFSHGRTRNAAAHDAKGDFVVYLTQDATPAHNRWLYEITKPFDLSSDIVAVLGKQDPRPKALPLLKSEIRGVFANLGNDNGTTVYYLDDFVKTQGQHDFISFYSDVNSAARRDFLTNTIQYQDVPYSEDQLFGRDLIKAGYKKAYAARANVVHTNEIKLPEYKKRTFDEIVGLRRVGIQVSSPGYRAIIKLIFKGTLRDWLHTIKDPEYSFKRKMYWLLLNPLFHVEKWRGFVAGTRVKLDDQDTIEAYSLESHRGRKNIK